MKPEEFRFDELIAASYANPNAKVHFTPSSKGYDFKWEWDGKVHELHIEREKLVFPDLILERLFEAAIEMAKK
ncbi:hypothetical protein ACRZ6Q_005039 [Citrobacter freundii]|nr:hypothetical protein [Citrobacter freundii]WBG05350.1 hypothetical protein O9240_14100 [Citrobacter freundii]